MSKYRVTLYYPTYRGADHEYAPYGEGTVVEADGARVRRGLTPRVDSNGIAARIRAKLQEKGWAARELGRRAGLGDNAVASNA